MKGVGVALERTGLAIEAYYTDDIVGLAIEEALSEISGKSGVVALKSKVPDSTGFQDDAAKYLSAEVGGGTAAAIFDTPKEITPQNQYSGE